MKSLVKFGLIIDYKKGSINNGVTKLKKFVLGVWTTLIYKQPFQIELNVSDLKKVVT